MSQIQRTFLRVTGLAAGRADQEFPSGTMDKTSRAVIPGSRPSRHWVITHHINAPPRLENEDDDEYEYEIVSYRCPKYSSCINWSSLRFSIGPSAAISPCCSK